MASSTKRFKASAPSHSLHEAILEENRAEVTRLLIKETVDPNQRGFNYSPSEEEKRSKGMPRLPDLAPIHLTVIKNNLDSFKLLLQSKDININIRCGKPFELNSLELAAIFERNEWIQLLIQRKALLPKVGLRLNQKDVKKRLPVDPFNKEFAIKALTDQLNTWYSGGSFFHYLFENGLWKESVLKNLVVFGLNIDDQNNPMKRTPLHASCAFNSIPKGRVDILLKHGADITLRDEEGNTPLMIALRHARGKDSMETLKRLIPTGEVLMAVNSEGYNVLSLVMRFTPLSHAFLFTNFIRKNGGDLLQDLMKGRSLFYSASISEQVITKIRYLLKEGLKPSFDDVKVNIEKLREKVLNLFLSKHTDLGLTRYLPKFLTLILQHFSGINRLQFFKYLVEDLGVVPVFDEESRASIRSLIACPDYNDDILSLIQYLISRGWKPQGEDLESAFGGVSHEVLNLLLDQLKEENLKEKLPNALVLLAVKDKYRRPYFLLLKRLIEEFSFDPNHCDFGGSSDGNKCSFLLELIRRIDEETVIRCLDFLLTLNGFDVNVLLNEETPLSLSVERGYYDLAQKLIRNYADSAEVIFQVNVVSYGFSGLFKLLYYSGYYFESNLPLEGRERKAQREVELFKEWLKEEQKNVFSLQRMAGNVVRRVYGKEVKDILEERDFPEEVQNVLLLKGIDTSVEKDDEFQSLSSFSDEDSDFSGLYDSDFSGLYDSDLEHDAYVMYKGRYQGWYNDWYGDEEEEEEEREEDVFFTEEEKKE